MSENAIDENEGHGDSGRGVPVWFWVVAVVALLWNLVGLMVFVMQVTMLETVIADLNDAQKELMNNTPMWVTIAFGVGVVAGTLGCVGLLMRSKWAFPVFILSLLGIIAQQTYMFFLSDTMKVMESGPAFPITILVIAILLVVFSKMSIGKGWLYK